MMRTLIAPEQLHALLGRDDLLVVDSRSYIPDPPRGRREYDEQHIPGAVFADLNADLSDLSRRGLGRHPLPSAEAFSNVLARWGWKHGTSVVVYDDASGAIAARLWWLLRIAGHESVAVLDGGIAAWRAAGLPLESAPVVREASHADVSFDEDQIVGTDELQADRDEIMLLDARAAPRFRGENETIDPVAGHVPGARNRPFSDNLDGGRFKDAELLRAEFDALLGAAPASCVVHMCGSGVTACHNLLAMERAGLPGSRVYAPSWSGWIADPSRPVARG
jgi:thiosulfate/3-mercaptopyruvate sulfurtransferase